MTGKSDTMPLGIVAAHGDALLHDGGLGPAVGSAVVQAVGLKLLDEELLRDRQARRRRPRDAAIEAPDHARQAGHGGARDRPLRALEMNEVGEGGEDGGEVGIGGEEGVTGGAALGGDGPVVAALA